MFLCVLITSVGLKTTEEGKFSAYVQVMFEKVMISNKSNNIRSDFFKSFFFFVI